MKKSLSAIVLGSLGLFGCVAPLDLRKQYPMTEKVSGTIIDVDEDSFLAQSYTNNTILTLLANVTDKELYQFPFEVLRIKTDKEIKKVLIPHASSYKEGDEFSSDCRTTGGFVAFNDLARATFGPEPRGAALLAGVEADYIFLEHLVKLGPLVK